MQAGYTINTTAISTSVHRLNTPIWTEEEDDDDNN